MDVVPILEYERESLNNHDYLVQIYTTLVDTEKTTQKYEVLLGCLLGNLKLNERYI